MVNSFLSLNQIVCLVAMNYLVYDVEDLHGLC